MTKYSEAQKQSILKYAKQSLKRIPLDVQKADYENRIVPAATKAGMTINGFIKQAINEKIERDNLI